MSPKKKVANRRSFAGFWSKLRHKNGPQESGEDCGSSSQSTNTTNPQTPGDTLELHEPALVGRPGVSQTSEQNSADGDSLWDQAYSALEKEDPGGILRAYNNALLKIYEECMRIPK